MASIGDIISSVIYIANIIIEQLDKIEENSEIKNELIFRVKIIKNSLEYIIKEDENLEIVKNIELVLKDIESYIVKRDEDNELKKFIFAKKINDDYKKLILLLDTRISQLSLLMTIKSRKSIDENFDVLENKLNINEKNIEERLKNILKDIDETDKNVSMRVLGITSIGQRAKINKIDIENEDNCRDDWNNMIEIVKSSNNFNGINMDIIGNTAIGSQSEIKEIKVKSYKKNIFEEECLR